MSSVARAARPQKRDGFWYLVRRVPLAYRHIEPRAVVKSSTSIRITDDPKGITAVKHVASLDARLQQFWQDKTEGKDADLNLIRRSSVERAEALSLVPLDINAANGTPTSEFWSRWLKIASGRDIETLAIPDKDRLRDVFALFGTETPKTDPAQGLKVSELITAYEKINATVLARKSPRQLKRWRNERQMMLDNFLEVTGGDRLVSELSTEHTHKFRSYWQQRALRGEIRIESANRFMRRIAGLYKVVSEFHHFDKKNPFSKMNIAGARPRKRIAYTADLIQRHFLADGMFDRLNPEARRVIYLIVETGVRLSEACALNDDTIHLDADIPYIEISDETQDTKTEGSVRRIPLVGVALLAMRQQPEGFPRYRDKADVLSALINDALNDLNLRPGGKRQSLYSLRHALADRLRAVEAPRDIQEDILAHVHMYGDGTSLDHKHKYLLMIALRPPSSV